MIFFPFLQCSAFIFVHNNTLVLSLALSLLCTHALSSSWWCWRWQTNRKISYQWLFHPENVFGIDFVFRLFSFSFLPLSLTLIVVNKNRHHSRIANDIIYQQMYLNMLCSLFFFGSHNFFSVFFSFLQRRSSSSTFLLSFDRISFDFLSIFSHFLYATGFTDQLLSLWFVCLAIFSHSAHSFAPSLSRALEIVPFRFSVFDKFTECAPTEYIFASQYFSFVRWMVCIYRACIYNAHPHRITFTMFDVCQRVFRSLALCEIFAHINCEPESHAFRFGSQLNNKKSSSWMMFWHKLPAEKKRGK